MSCCVSILVHNSSLNAGIPPAQRVSNGLYLDLDSDFQLRLSKVLEELFDINKIRVDGVLGFGIPSTPTNDLVLRQYVLPTRVGVAPPLNVYIYIGSRILPNTELHVVGYKNGEYDCELRPSGTHWVVGAKNLKLKDIDLGDPFVVGATTLQNFNGLGGYVDGTQGARFPLAFYGAWHGKQTGKISPVNYRPFLSLLWVLQKGACALGWTFRSPVFESDWGRRLIGYMVSDEFFTDKTLLVERRFSARRTFVDSPVSLFPSASWHFGSPIRFSDELFDNGGHFNSGSDYSGAGIHDFHVTLKVQFGYENISQLNQAILSASTLWSYGSILDLFEERMNLQVLLKYYASVLGYDILVDDKVVSFKEFKNVATLDGGLRYTADITVVFKDIQIDPTDYVYVSVGGDSSSGLAIVAFFDLLGNSTFRNEPKSIFLQDGDEYTFQSLLGSKYTFLDFLKGCAHLVNGKLYTDNNKKELWLFPPYSTKIYQDEIVEGYFVDGSSTIDLDSTLVCDSESVETPSVREKRYKILKFNGDGDYEIKQLNLEENTDIFGYKVDYGEQYKEEYEISENPFFAPTLNKLTDGVSVNIAHLVDIPHIHDDYDTENPKMEFKLQPRVLYWAGEVGQLYNGESVLIDSYGLYDDVMPYAYQYQNAILDGIPEYKGGVAYGALGVTLPREDIIKNNLFKFFWQRWLNETDINFSVGLLLKMSVTDYFAVSFRNAYSFSFLGRTIFGRLVAVEDFASCDATSTPVKLLPSANSIAACLNVDSPSGVNPCATNAPTLNITKSGNTYSFSIGGTNTSLVTSVVFQWQYIGETTWTTATSVTAPTGSFMVRMVVTYSDGCPPITRNRLVDACGNSPSFNFQYNYSGKCFTITTSGAISSPLDSITVVFSEDGGVTWIPYVPCQFTSALLITVRVTWAFADGCPDITIDNQFTIPPTEVECSATDADAICDANTGMITRTGEVVGAVALDIIEWRVLGDDLWRVWNEVDGILDCPFEYRRVIFFCSNECPTYCGDIHICDCIPCAATVDITGVGQLDGSYILTANTTNCTGVEYVWSIDTGSGFTPLGLTTQSISATISGTYKVDTTCDGICQQSDTITIEVTCALPTGNATNIEVCNDL